MNPNQYENDGVGGIPDRILSRRADSCTELEGAYSVDRTTDPEATARGYRNLRWHGYSRHHDRARHILRDGKAIGFQARVSAAVLCTEVG